MANQTSNKVSFGSVDIEFYGSVLVKFARSQRITGRDVCEFVLTGNPVDAAIHNISTSNTKIIVDVGGGKLITLGPLDRLEWDTTGFWSIVKQGFRYPSAPARTSTVSAATTSVVPPIVSSSLSIHKETHGDVEVEFHGNVSVYFTKPQTCFDVVRFTLINATPGSRIKNVSSTKTAVVFTQPTGLPLTITSGDTIECDANGVFSFVKTITTAVVTPPVATGIQAKPPVYKYTLLLKSKDGSIEISKLKPSSSSTTQENPRSGVHVEFAEYGGPVSSAGYAERVDVYRDASLYASVPIIPTYCSYGMDVSNFRVVVLDAHIVNKVASLDDIEPATKSNGCTCGTWSTGGLCADYCDLVRSA